MTRRTQHAHQATGQLFSNMCDKHDKAIYFNRRAAKTRIRVIGDSMRPYRCDHVDGGWHIGHLPGAVKRGVTTVADFYQTKADATRVGESEQQ